jgi:hypothetical protein
VDSPGNGIEARHAKISHSEPPDVTPVRDDVSVSSGSTLGSVVDRPGARLLRTFRDAELAARDWLRWLGFSDAECTGNGRDGGIDVVGLFVAAQVKMEARPSTRVQLQLLTGAAAPFGYCQTVFFSLSGYTGEAILWADRVHMALFSFDMQGQPVAVNQLAVDLIDRVPSTSESLVQPMAGGAWEPELGIYGSLAELPLSYRGSREEQEFMPDQWRPLDWPLEEGIPCPPSQVGSTFPLVVSDWEWLSATDDDALLVALQFRRRLRPRPRLQFGCGQSGVGFAWLAMEMDCPKGQEFYAIETAPLPSGRNRFDLSIYAMSPPVTAYCTSLEAVLRYTLPWRRLCLTDNRLVLTVCANEASASSFGSRSTDLKARRGASGSR